MKTNVIVLNSSCQSTKHLANLDILILFNLTKLSNDNILTQCGKGYKKDKIMNTLQ